MAKQKQKQKKNGGNARKKGVQPAFRLEHGSQAQSAVDAGASDAFEPEQAAQAQSLPGQPAPVQEETAAKAQSFSFSFAFDVPRKTPAPEWQTIMVRVVPEDWNTLQALAEKAGIPLAAFCRAILHSAAQQAREQGAK